MKAINLEQEISTIAYELYEKSGRMEGRDLDNWLEAERIVRERLATKETSGIEKIVSSKRKTSRTRTKSLQQ